MRTPLTMITSVVVVSFLDGVFSWGLADGFYALTGLVLIGGLVWMWFLELTSK